MPGKIGKTLAVLALACAALVTPGTATAAPGSDPVRGYLGGVDLDSYCVDRDYDGVVLVRYNVYGWRCWYDDNGRRELASISMYDACRWQYQNPAAKPAYGEWENPYSWYCYT